MNLFYLLSGGDRNLTAGPGLGYAKFDLGGTVWSGLKLRPDKAPQVRLANATRWYPLRQRPESVGWCAMAPKGSGILRLEIRGNAGDVSVKEWRLDKTPVTLTLPWLMDDRSTDHELILHTPETSKGPVFVGVFKRLDRREVIDLCVGRGIEIGPGAQPQILPGPGVDVRYLEALPIEAWEQTYGEFYKAGVKPELADMYQVGEAHDLPAEDESLDFIFSSHVFEHLANPLGHLERWARKLRPGGRVVGVVPDIGGAKDYAASPSTLEEWREEFRAGVLKPTRRSTNASAPPGAIRRGRSSCGPATAPSTCTSTATTTWPSCWMRRCARSATAASRCATRPTTRTSTSP